MHRGIGSVEGFEPVEAIRELHEEYLLMFVLDMIDATGKVLKSSRPCPLGSGGAIRWVLWVESWWMFALIVGDSSIMPLLMHLCAYDIVLVRDDVH